MTYEYDPNRKPARRKKRMSTSNIVLITVGAAALCVVRVFAFFHYGLGLTYVKINTQIGGYVKFFGYVDDNKTPTKGDLFYSDGTTAKVDREKNEVTFSDGAVYTGALSSSLRMEGDGTLCCANGDTYVGGFKDGLFSGMGVYTYANGDRYEGTFSEGKKQGTGKITWADGSYYEGEFSNDKKNGQGEYHWADGSSYVGTFVDDLKNGQGTFRYANGDIYVGTFVDDARTGQGKYTWAAGDEYEGEFRDNAISGQGTYRFASGRTYTGQFENNEIVKDASTADTAA